MATLFENLHLIDGTGREMQKDATFLVDDGVIKAIHPDMVGVGETLERVDLQGNYVMPGLIDCHTHVTFPATVDFPITYADFTQPDITLMTIENLQNLLKSGVTYIRDVGDRDYIALDLKKHLQSGRIKGPGMHCAGLIVTMTGGHAWWIGREADGVDEVRKAVREQLKRGADLIKVVGTGGILTPDVDVNAYQFNVDELKAAAEETHKAGKKICAHCIGTQGIKNAVRAGIDSVEHASILDDEAIDMLAEAGTYIVPTLTAVHNGLKNADADGVPKFALEKGKYVAKLQIQSIQRAYKAGVKIAMGTDCGTPFNHHGSSSPQEVELMHNLGMTPMDAIVASTRVPAELIGIDQTHGTLETGKSVDFLVLAEDPLKNIKTLREPVSVYQKGKNQFYHRKERRVS